MKKRSMMVLHLLLMFSLLLPPLPAPKVTAQAAVSASTANHTDTPYALYEIAANTPYSGTTEGEHITDHSGVLRRLETDFTLPGRNGLDVSIGRLYMGQTALLAEPKAVQGPGQSVGNETESVTYPEQSAHLGAGWSWALPSLELRGTQKYLHLGDGTVYPVAPDYALTGYPLKDLTFGPSSETLQAENAALTAAASYALTDTLGTSVYFNGDGQWIGTKDAYGNTVVAAYREVTAGSGATLSLLSSIVDTLGRTVTFAYSGNRVDVSYAPGLAITYHKTAVAGQPGEYVLSAVDNENDETTRYAYEQMEASFDYDTSATPAAGELQYANLTAVTYPTGARTLYAYTPAEKKLGHAGMMDYFRVERRYDELKEGTDIRLTNRVDYEYSSLEDFNDPSQRVSIVRRALIANPNETGGGDPAEWIHETTTLDANYRVTRITRAKEEAYKKEISYAYDARRNLMTTISISDTDYSVTPAQSGTRTYTYAYDDYGNILSETNPLGHIEHYSYDPQFPGLLTGTQRTVGGVTVDDIAYTLASALPHAVSFVQRYEDDEGQRQQIEVEYEYDDYGNVTVVRQELEQGKQAVTEIDYAAAYRSAYPTNIRQQVTVDGSTKEIEERYAYDLPTGRVTKAYDANATAAGAAIGSEEAYTYDKVGRLLHVTRPRTGGEAAPSASTIAYAFDPAARLFTVLHTDEEGKKTRETYDGLGRPLGLELQRENGDFYTFETIHYNDLGEVDVVEDGEGNRTEYEYDVNGQVKSVTSAEGRMLGYAYNDMLMQATTTTDYGAAITTTRDALGRVTEETRENELSGQSITSSTAYEVDGDPYRAQWTSGRGSITGLKSDSLWRLGTVTQDGGSGPLQTSYRYNKLGNMTEALFPDLSSLAYGYDELGRRLSKADSKLGSETYTYDDNSNLTGGITREGIEVLNQYDERNRLKAWSSGSESGNYTYYKNGLRQSMTDETGTTEYGYRKDNQLEEVRFPDGKRISYTYYDNGLRQSMTDPFGVTTTYEYNGDNQLRYVKVDDEIEAEYVYRDNLVLTDGNYLKSSQLYQTKLAGGSLMTRFVHDGLGRLTELEQSGPAFEQTFQYAYDENDNIVWRSNGAAEDTFTYDHLDRITSSTPGSETYSYDGRGNRLTLQSTVQEPHTDTMTYQYDDAEQLEKVTRQDAEVTYKYNGDGLMTERTQGSVTTRYYYDGDNIIAEGTVAADGSVTFKARYVRGIQLILREDNWSKDYYQHNGHGDVTSLRQEDGTLTNEYDYDIWGNALVNEEGKPNPFRYSGEYWDETTGLQYLRSRWYDPSLGRFIQEDAFEGYVHRPDSMNPYVYVENNPLKYVDPYGYCVAGRDSGCYVDSFSGYDNILNNPQLSNNSNMWWQIEGYIENYCIDSSCISKQRAAQKKLEQDSDAIRNNVCYYTDCASGKANFILSNGKAVGVRLQVEISEDSSIWNSVGDALLGTPAYANEIDLPPGRIRTSYGNIEHYYRSGDHAPPHVHLVDQNGKVSRVGQNGKPISSKDDAAFNRNHQLMVNSHRGVIRSTVSQIMRYYRQYPDQRIR